MRFEDGGGGVLEGHVEILADVVVAGDGVEQAAGDAVGVGVEEAQPAQAFDAGEGVEEGGEAVFDAQVFAVAGGVLADEGDLAGRRGRRAAGLQRRRTRSGGSGICRAGWG